MICPNCGQPIWGSISKHKCRRAMAARKIAALAACAALLTACGSAAPAAKPAASPSTMSLLQSCRALRADMVANGGQADRVTLSKIVNESTSSQLVSDAAQAEDDVGNSTTWWVDASLLAHDCLSTGVDIPTEAQ